jgi:hypothetical protein
MRPASAATWIAAALIAVALVGDIYRISIQVPDSLELIQDMQAVPSVGAAFREGLRSSATIFRPLRQVQTKLLLDAGAGLGHRYHLVFRGYHAVLIAALIAVFVVVARVRSWTDAAACIIGLTVLIGTHTFSGFLREAYPVNHFLLIALCALATLALAFTRGGWFPDVAAIMLFVFAVLTLESGVLLWVVVIAAYASGLRGLSWRALLGISLLCVGYFVLRESYLHMTLPGVGDRPTAFGVAEVTPEEQIARFGKNPIALYAYNVVSSFLSVVLSQPRAGRWTVIEAAQRGQLTPVFYVEILSSIAATCLIGWYLMRHDQRGRGRWREPIPLVFVCVLLANAVISFAYTKSEIVSVSGVFYALTLSVAIKHLLPRTPPARLGMALTIFLFIFNAAWAMRAAGLHAVMLRAAFSSRNEWVGVLMPGHQDQSVGNADTLALTTLLKREAISKRGAAPGALPRWTHRWWGEE